MKAIDIKSGITKISNRPVLVIFPRKRTYKKIHLRWTLLLKQSIAFITVGKLMLELTPKSPVTKY